RSLERRERHEPRHENDVAIDVGDTGKPALGVSFQDDGPVLVPDVGMQELVRTPQEADEDRHRAEKDDIARQREPSAPAICGLIERRSRLLVHVPPLDTLYGAAAASRRIAARRGPMTAVA